MIQQTLSIIKPDATQRHLVGEILAQIEQSGLHIHALKMVHLTREQAEGFYAEHQGKEFLNGWLSL